MQRLSVFLFTSILGRKIYDEFDRSEERRVGKECLRLV